MDRAERSHFGMLGSPIPHSSPHYRPRQDNSEALPSIDSILPYLYRPPGGLNPSSYGYPLEPPTFRATRPSTLPQYPPCGDDTWAHKQGQRHPSTPLTSTMHYQKTNPEHTQPQHSPNNSNLSSRRHEGNWKSEVITQARLDRVSMGPTTETTDSYQDAYSVIESGTDIYSDQGESEINSGIGDTQSQAGSTASGMYLRKFVCKTCKMTFKCDSLRRKHEMKHTKPFKCHFPDCKRKGQGFTSANDRDRHMNSVHKSHLSRPAIGYDCCYDHCRGNGKIFWRLDNFRNHLKKKHDPNGSKEQLEEFLKRAETECRRAHPPPGADTSMDTRSEPGYSVPCTSMGSPDPAMSVDIHLPRQSRRSRPPPVPRFPCWESASESGGFGQLPISPVSRGPNRDIESDAGDRMDIDDIPESVAATSHPRATEPLSDTDRTNGPQVNGPLSHANFKVSSEGQGQGKESYAQAQARSERSQKLDELLDEIKGVPKILRLYNDLCDEEGDYFRDRYELVAVRYTPSEASGRTMPMSYGHNNDECDMDEPQLASIEENEPDCMDRDDFRHSRASHSLQAFIAQGPADESVMSRLLSSNGTAAPTAVASSSATQVDTQCLPRQLVSPPISVASPQAATTEVSQAHQQQQAIVIPDDELPALDPTQSSTARTSPRGPRGPPHGTTQKHGASHPPQNGKNTTCPECDKQFTMPSKLRKHMKRHSRPYACTFRGCGKLFGSKNDWKRHENSQHFQLELWKCGVIPPNSSGLCGKLSFRRESHTTHLRSIHGITDKHEISTRTADAHIGRNNFKSFWCGFCPSIPGQDEHTGTVVNLHKKGLGGWDERFDHLGKHFIDDGLGINKYKFHDDEGQYGQTQPSSEDEEDGEMTAAEPTVVEKQLQTARMDSVLEDYDTRVGANARQKAVVCTAPDAEKRGVELAQAEMGTMDLKKPMHKAPSPLSWYCCQQCSYTGPYTEALVVSCVSCEHAICDKCEREPHNIQ